MIQINTDGYEIIRSQCSELDDLVSKTLSKIIKKDILTNVEVFSGGFSGKSYLKIEGDGFCLYKKEKKEYRTFALYSFSYLKLIKKEDLLLELPEDIRSYVGYLYDAANEFESDSNLEIKIGDYKIEVDRGNLYVNKKIYNNYNLNNLSRDSRSLELGKLLDTINNLIETYNRNIKKAITNNNEALAKLKKNLAPLLLLDSL